MDKIRPNFNDLAHDVAVAIDVYWYTRNDLTEYLGSDDGFDSVGGELLDALDKAEQGLAQAILDFAGKQGRPHLKLVPSDK